MPELPEVETIAEGVNARVRGRRIVSAFFGAKPEPLKSAPEEMLRALTDRTIQRVRRVGKHIVFDLADKPGSPVRAQWLVHLGMTGRLLVAQPEIPVAAHTHAILQLEDQREIRFVDPRRFGRLSVLWLDAKGAAKSSSEGFAGTGREPLTISEDDFYDLFHKRHAPIKAMLLNQSLLHGVGNIYADESLFHAGVRPKRQAARLTRAELLRLRQALQQVLRNAIALGGSSVSDYVDADGARGFFQLEHRVYMRTGEPCLVCGTPIRRIVLAGRGTHYCPQCQR
ncbi:MAG TPA: bifunctional DNA-formamidopyrimidine glycosylase/DNA-(apurinic or apyrimidinic site) lyase [Acidobacteriaceae bacterium]|jgi:formamidopyrimidine-DNA glycosylase|nr:bifunctional DNA-formamidopyrimidine glycosylase/DNA-(apurinic or apyrimidinic site) lyase [Acidobacteriaceae bacterium]